MLYSQKVAQLDALAFMHPSLDLQSLFFGFVLSLQLLDSLIYRFELLFMIQREVNRRCDITLPDVGHLLFTHFCLCADVVEDIVDDLEREAEVLADSKTLNFKRRFFWRAQYWHSS